MFFTPSKSRWYESASPGYPDDDTEPNAQREHQEDELHRCHEDTDQAQSSSDASDKHSPTQARNSPPVMPNDRPTRAARLTVRPRAVPRPDASRE